MCTQEEHSRYTLSKRVSAPFFMLLNISANPFSEWAQVTFQSPYILRFCDVENTHDEEASLDESAWYFYRYEDDQCPAWPSLLTTTNREKIKLISIINSVSMMICSPLSHTITARQVLEQYGRFAAWRVALPPILGDTETSTQTLPHVLSLL